jgi:hypothetical protein
VANPSAAALQTYSDSLCVQCTPRARCTVIVNKDTSEFLAPRRVRRQRLLVSSKEGNDKEARCVRICRDLDRQNGQLPQGRLWTARGPVQAIGHLRRGRRLAERTSRALMILIPAGVTSTPTLWYFDAKLGR